MDYLKNLFFISSLIFGSLGCSQNGEQNGDFDFAPFTHYSSYPQAKDGDYSKIATSLEKSCDAKNAKACFDLAYLYAKGLGVEKDYSKAKNFVDKSCNLGSKRDCEYKLHYLQEWTESVKGCEVMKSLGLKADC